MRRAGRIASRLALALFVTLLSLVAAEHSLRALGYEYRPMSVEIGKRDTRFQHLFYDRHFVYDPGAIWRPKPGFGVFNRQGYRGPELPAVKPERATWVFALGDSNTLGWAGPDGASWPAELGGALRRIDPEVVVVNAGVWGYSSYQGLRRLEKILEHRPDLVLISFGSNDAHLVDRPDREFASGGLRGTRLEERFRHYRLGQLMIAAWDKLWIRGERELRHRVGAEEYEANLREMISRARAVEAKAVLLTRPYEGAIRDDLWWKRFGARYNAATARVAEAEGAALVDLYSFFKERRELFADESHFTAEGHRQAAEIIALHLRPLLRRVGPEAEIRR